jgi:hypothetical protein
MNRGCLYWDESSRGMKNGRPDRRGRWCAEKSVNGRTIRMRSADMNKCLEFLNEAKGERLAELPCGLQDVVGFKSYKIDKESGEIYSTMQGFRKLKPRAISGVPCVQMRIGAKRTTLSVWRLMYAARHGIGVTDIPATIEIRMGEQGELQVIDHMEKMHKRRKETHHEQCRLKEQILESRIKESEIMLQAYRTQDFGNLYLHLLGMRDDIVKRMQRRYNYSMKRTMYLVDAAIDKLFDKLKSGNSLVMNLGLALMTIAYREAQATKGNVSVNENEIYYNSRLNG